MGRRVGGVRQDVAPPRYRKHPGKTAQSCCDGSYGDFAARVVQTYVGGSKDPHEGDRDGANVEDIPVDPTGVQLVMSHFFPNEKNELAVFEFEVLLPIMAFVNNPSDIVDQAIDGAVAASGSLTRLEGTRVVLRSDWNKDKVALISGGKVSYTRRCYRSPCTQQPCLQPAVHGGGKEHHRVAGVSVASVTV